MASISSVRWGRVRSSCREVSGDGMYMIQPVAIKVSYLKAGTPVVQP